MSDEENCTDDEAAHTLDEHEGDPNSFIGHKVYIAISIPGHYSPSPCI
jgi:hypothetical protein